MNEIEKVVWQDEYSVGIAEIDEQHKKLVAIMNELYNLLTVNSKNYDAKVVAVVKELAEYTDYHFTCEEKEYFGKYDYPSTDIHVMQHNNFIGQVTDKMRHIDKMTIEDGKSFYSYLKSWLLSHIARADKAWAAYVIPKLPK